METGGKKSARWDAGGVRRLRKHLGMTQQALADELGARQQTVSEWETGMYSPRGTSARLLSLIAERAGFVYEATEAENSKNQAPDSEEGIQQSDM